MIDNNIIRWIVGIIVIVNIIGILYPTYGLYTSINSLSELSEKYQVYDFETEHIENSLTDSGYEVIYVRISNYSANAPFFEWYDIEDDTICSDTEKYCDSDKVGVSVEMKSLGNRNEQIWDTLITMHSAYSNAFTYRIDIKSPIDTCSYVIFGNILENYFADYNSETRELIDDYIDNVECS